MLLGDLDEFSLLETVVDYGFLLCVRFVPVAHMHCARVGLHGVRVRTTHHILSGHNLALKSRCNVICAPCNHLLTCLTLIELKSAVDDFFVPLSQRLLGLASRRTIDAGRVCQVIFWLGWLQFWSCGDSQAAHDRN